MMNNHLESLKFHYFLHLLAHPGRDVSLEKGELILLEAKDQVYGSREERIREIGRYLSTHHHQLTPKGRELIKRIEDKFSHKIEISERPGSPIMIAIKVAPTPHSWEELKKNLRLIQQYFPRYQLHQDLSVYDTKYQSVPHDWNFEEIHRSLLTAFNRYEVEMDAEGDSAKELRFLKQEILDRLKWPVPIQLGILLEAQWANSEKKALFSNFMHLFNKNMPIIVNHEFFETQQERLQTLKMNHYTIYLQKTGGLALFIPKILDPKAWGFNLEKLEEWQGFVDPNPFHEIPPMVPLNFARDIKRLLLKETEKERFFRLIFFNGHGSYPGFPNALDDQIQGVIASLSSSKFQKGLLALKERNLAFLHLKTCYGGGTNSQAIHLPNRTIPCPIYVHSSFDVSTRTGLEPRYDFTPILEMAENILFSPKNPLKNFPFFSPRSWVSSDTRKLTKVVHQTHSGIKSNFAISGTLFLPTTGGDIPRIAYTLPSQKGILDISHKFKRLHFKQSVDPLKAKDFLGSIREPGLSFEDRNANRRAYLFSHPMVPFSLSLSPSGFIFLSRGGHTHHLIKAIHAPNQDLETIAKETFNAFHYSSKSSLEPAYKAFFIAELRCKFQNREVNLSRVVIKNSSDEREVIFQYPGEERYCKLIFTKIGRDPHQRGKTLWKQERQAHFLSASEGLQAIYLTMAKSSPSASMLLQTTAGRQSPEEFLEALNTLFFPEKMPDEARLNSALLHDIYRNQRLPNAQIQTLHLDHELKEFKERQGDFTQERLNEILGQAMDIALYFREPIYQEKIKELTYTPLMQAIKRGDMDQVRRILENDPGTLDAVQLNGSTALSISVKDKKFEIARLLIERGAQLMLPNRFGQTPLSYICTEADFEFIRWVLEYRHPIQLGEGGIQLVKKAIQAKRLVIAQLLLDHNIVENAEVRERLSTLISQSSKNRFYD